MWRAGQGIRGGMNTGNVAGWRRSTSVTREPPVVGGAVSAVCMAGFPDPIELPLVWGGGRPPSLRRRKLSRKSRGQSERGSVLGPGCRQVLGDDRQGVGVAHHELLAAQLDDAQRLPGRERARDGVQGGAGHLGEILAGERKAEDRKSTRLNS